MGVRYGYGLHYFDLFSLLEFDLFSKLYSDLPITGKLYFDLQALLTYRLVSLTLIYIVLLWSISFEASRTLIYKNNACCKVIYNNLFGISWYRSQFVIRWTLIYTNLMPAGGFYWYRSQQAIMDFTHNVLLSVVHSCSMGPYIYKLAIAELWLFYYGYVPRVGYPG